MPSYSDNNNKPRTNIFELLPEVYHSNLNEALFEDSFNRHLTKDDTTRVTGFIGVPNPNALVNRQIPEPTPYRQAFQLQPAMYTKVGTVDYVLTQPGFLKQLELIGVDINRLPEWGNTLVFNWVPPVNIDMLLNYFDYYWVGDDAGDLPQYFTIENRCNKAIGKANSYQKTVDQYGATHTIVTMNVSNNSFVIDADLSTVMIEGFVFFTTNTADVNIEDAFWTVSSSTYDEDADQLTIFVQEDIAYNSLSTAPPPVSEEVTGRLWYQTDTGITLRWSGVAWVATAVVASGEISLTELLELFRKNANCICDEEYGWDIGLWDDNQPGSVVWNVSLLASISYATEADWILANGIPVDLDLWYDTTTDQLKQYFSGTFANIIFNNFSTILALTDGLQRWDFTVGCVPQELNQWSEQNKWFHKTEIGSFANVKRAQIPILEYNSTIELNAWTQTSRSWKYRSAAGEVFETISDDPYRWELEPIKSYAAALDGGVWYLYLFDKTVTLNRDINHTDYMTPGTQLHIVDDGILSQIYTVASAEYRKTVPSDPIVVRQDYYVTVVALQEAVFTAPVVGGGVLNTRIIPTLTSQGDVWRGYHVHWCLDASATSTVASTSHSTNPFLTQSYTETPTTSIVPGGILDVGVAHQVFTSTIVGVTTVDLSPYFLYDSAESRFYATPNSNEIRVYKNNVRQYGSYVENTADGAPNYTVVGNSTTTLATIPYVTGITFDQPLAIHDIVRIEICPAAYDDMGLYAVPVRTTEDETAFTTAVSAGTEPVYQSLSVYGRSEQAKTELNQYPLFNVYNVCEDVVINASSIFAYKEEADCPINPYVRRRIVATTDGRDYSFIQYLVDRDDNYLYGYRNLDKAPEIGTYWYSSLYNTVLRWDGLAWSDTTLLLTSDGYIAARQVVISETEPMDLLTVDGAMWLQPSTETLYQRNNISMTWLTLSELVVSEADPTLETIWKNGNNTEYVPEYVNAQREPVPVGDPQGDWELLDWWLYNSEHKNKQCADYSQLVVHFRTIIDSQPPVPGLAQGGVYTLTQNEYDYGLGGTIKEHNDSFDTLISAINVTNTTPVGLMEWAEDQYTLGLLFMRDMFNRDITSLYGNYSQESLADQTGVFSDDLIQQYKFNDFLSAVYGDTTAYNSDTNIGVPNWIATIPIFRLGQKYVPYVLETDDFIEIYHHDGHRSRIYYTAGETDRYARKIIAIPDGRVANGTLGIQSIAIQPQTQSDFLAAFGGGEMRTGVYWYRLGGGFRNLYRFIPYAVSNGAPSFYLDGVEIPDGTRYYDIMDDLTYIKSGLSWVVDTGVVFDISTLWEEVSFGHDLAEVILTIETSLYEIAPDTPPFAFDYSTLTPTPSEQVEYDRLYEQRFFAFVAERNIKAPLVNTTYSATNAFTWNYVTSIITTPPRLDISPDNASAWQELYTRWYGTPYPHLEPWKMQGYLDKPSWWDAEYLNTAGSCYGNRRWKYIHSVTATFNTCNSSALTLGSSFGMWENIRIGAIPAGEELPDGSGVGTGTAGDVPYTFNYFCVNIADSAVGGYAPDDVFPPYLSSTTVGFSSSVRSLFSNIIEIVAPDADYAFKDVGPTEWLWTVSSEYPYDIAIIAFLMQPARFLQQAFGLNFIDVDKLQVETTFCQVYSHEDALFHGDLYDTNVTYIANGLNQWYVNFNRFTGYDTNAEFRALWAGWNPMQSYSFAGIIDTSTFEITSKYFDVVKEDYNIVLANTGVFKDIWAEGFEVSILNIPPAIIQYNNQAQWKFDVDSLATVDRNISYYDVRLYPFALDFATDIGTLQQFGIVGANAGAQRFSIDGNKTTIFAAGVIFTVSGSSLNDGVYTVMSSVYEPATLTTRINVIETVPSSIGDGIIDITSFVSPWETGQTVVVQSTEVLPAPLVNGVPYFIIRTSPRTFQLAETVANAQANIPIDIITPGSGELLIGEIHSSFFVYAGAGTSREVWYHYAIDTNRILSVTPPTQVMGMQNLINFFDGYAAFQTEQDEVFNALTSIEVDEQTGRTINWQFEIERFIDWAYGLRRSRMQIADRYEFTLNGSPATMELKFSNAAPAWVNGTPIVFGTTGSLPAPLIAGVTYYFAQTATPGVFSVSITSNITIPGNLITFTTSGSGTLTVARHRAELAYPSLEVNPTRNNIWIDTPLGLMSDIITGPYKDIRVNQTIFDQYGRQLTADKLNIYRQDTRSQISIRPNLPDDLSMIPPVLQTQYDYLHLGGGHFFLEGYEHVILFNDYAVGGAVIYDQFYGIFTSRFNLDYFEAANYTLRPTIGGYYLVGNKFFRNIEASTVDAHNYYDTYDLREQSVEAPYARDLVGYKGTQDYLDLVNLNSKSQFLFYKGLIQYKGSVAATQAYVNSRRFIDAKVDEFWAWKIAEFGDARPKVYPEIKLLSSDATVQDVRMYFLDPTESVTDDDVADAIENGFIPVDFKVPDRWEIYPEQKADIVSPLFLDADVTSMWRVYAGTVVPIAGQNTVDYWFDPSIPALYSWNGGTTGTIADWDVVAEAPIDITINAGTTYVKLDQFFDTARAIQHSLTTPGDLREYTTFAYPEGTGLQEFNKVNSEIISFQSAGFDGVMLMFTINPGFSKINPSKLIDNLSHTVKSNAQLWDPARNHHSTVAIHNVKLENPQDPAGYLVTENPNNVADYAWGALQVGTTWLDTSVLQYVKYYDDVLYPNVDNRLALWGDLASYGDVQVFQWTESTVPPDEWAALVAQQANDTRPQRTKATGTARQTLFKRTRPSYTATVEGITSGSQTADFGGGVTGGGSTGLAAGTAGYQDILMTTTFLTTDVTGLTGTAPFQANVFIDGDNYLLSISAASAATYSTLLTQINNQLLGAAIATYEPSSPYTTIRITSSSTGLGSSVIIQDINLFGSLIDAPAIIQIAIPGASTTYTATFTLDGIDYDISVLGDDAQTFDDLTSVITSQISGFGALDIVGGDLVVSSTAIGTDSTVLVTDVDLFSSLTGFSSFDTPIDGTYGVIRVAGAGTTDQFDIGEEIIFTTTGTMPSPLIASVTYITTNVTLSGADQLVTVEDTEGAAVNILTEGTPTLTAVPSFSTDWQTIPFLSERQYGPVDYVSFMPSYASPTLVLTSSLGWAEGDKADVYINDALVTSVTLDSSLTITLTGVTLTETDIIDIVRPLRALTAEEAGFDPDIADDGTMFVQWKYDYEYSVFTTYSDSVPVQTYYFWVQNSQLRDVTDNTSLSVFEVAIQLRTIPTPYFVVQHPKDDPILIALYGYGLIPYGSTWSLGNLAEQFLTIPVLYREATLRGAANFITEDNRYVWRFTRDLTLRNTLKDRVNLKSKHEEWFLIRREQPSTIPRELWDRLTEAMIGYKLDDPAQRVPTLERELYDALYETDTQYGLGVDQAFVNGTLAIGTIVAYLEDPDHDFAPIDIDTFFATFSFDTPANIEIAMAYIYDSFATTHVNNMWFNTLLDAFTTRSKYKELLKTSWVALHGIRVLEVGGLFDD